MAEKWNPNLPVAVGGDVKALSEYLNKNLLAISQLSGGIVDPRKLVRLAVAELQRTPDLKQASFFSIFRAVKDAASLGLEIGGALKQGYLVRYGSECQFLSGYQGLKDLALQHDRVLDVDAKAVREGDEFAYEYGIAPVLRHKPGDDPEAKITHVYCIVRLRGCDVPHFEVMSAKAVDKIRARSKAKNNGPWVTDYEEMAKKTVMRRTLKYVPRSVRLAQAMLLDEAVDTGERNVVDAEFDVSDMPETPAHKNGAQSVKEKLGIGAEPAEVQPVDEEAACEALRNKIKKLGGNATPGMSHDALLALHDDLSSKAAQGLLSE